METTISCPICQNNSFSPFLICNDYLVSQKSFELQECTSCGFRITNPHPNEQEIGQYYQSDQYISHNDANSGMIGSLYKAARVFTLRTKVNLINKVNKGIGKVLDVGCGTGAFLDNCRQVGWQIIGVEPNKEAAAVAAKRLGLEIEPGLKEITEVSSVDVITLWHVLEHVPDLNNTIKRLYQILTEKGTLLIAVPNSNSYDARYFKQYWAAYDVPRHLYHFTPDTIETLFRNHGFSLIEKRPMPLDAFYIALLSTRYQTGDTNYLKSIQVGWQSNYSARKTGNSSSQIYLFKK